LHDLDPLALLQQFSGARVPQLMQRAAHRTIGACETITNRGWRMGMRESSIVGFH
jgi:hypothetical protein